MIVRTPPSRPSPWSVPALVGASLAIAYGPMPLVYGFVAFHGQWARMAAPPVPGHIVLNASANAVVMLAAIAVRGRLDRKLAGVITRTLVVHGAVAFFILVTRQWYSIPILLTAVVSSGALGAAVVLIRQRGEILRIGLIGPPHAALEGARLDYARIQTPSDPIGRFDLIVVTAAAELPAAWMPTLVRALLAGKRVRHVADFLEEARGAVAIEHFDLDQLPPGGLTSYRARKRLLDLLCVATALPLALPLLMGASLGILVTMGRPILFIQSRVGLGGKVFRMIKLRTMRTADPGAAQAPTGPRDSRVTPLGRSLRRFRIDEIPQLWNVLAADMSFVGPRPEWTTLAEIFSAQEKAYDFRHLVRPGITGWAQVNAGPAADLAETRIKLGYDLFYIKHLSFSLDLQILLRTVSTLITGGGAR